jgi:hypothetical protein
LDKTLLRQPKSLAIVSQEPDRGGTATTKNEDAAGEWIGIEFFAAQLDQGIDTIAPIDCLNGN